MSEVKGWDRSKFLSMGEVIRALGPRWNRPKVLRRIQDGRLPAMKPRGRNWYFPKEPAERAIAKLRASEEGEVLDLAELERIALTMLREGRKDGEVVLETRLSLAPRARLNWLPRETILFEGASLRRRLEVDFAGDATLLVVETLVFGRLAMGETAAKARLAESWRIRRADRLVFADELRLDRAAAALDRPAVGAGARAAAMIVAAAPAVEARLPDLRAALEGESEEVEAGASFFDGIVVARLVSPSPARLRERLIAAILALGGGEPPRLWR